MVYIHRWYVLLILSCIWVKGYTQENEFNPTLVKAYQSAINLQLQDAKTYLQDYQKPEPLFFLVEDYIDFFSIFINQDYSQLNHLEAQKTLRLSRLLQANESSSPYYRYALAEIYLHWSLIYLQIESYWPAYRHFKKAYKYLTENQSLFPSFMANYKSLGILHAALGTIPNQYKGVFTFFSGMSGTVDQGRAELDKVIEYASKHDNFLFKEETYVLYSLLLLHLENQGDEAWELIQNVESLHSSNPLITFCKANVAMRTGRNDAAIDLLFAQQYAEGQLRFDYLEFMKGLTFLRKLDYSAASYFQTFVQRNRGRNYEKEGYQKLAWIKLLEQDSFGYQTMMERINSAESEVVDGDKNAQKEYEEYKAEASMPNPVLLKARLLFDGGYYDRALKLLEQNASQFKSSPNLLEYYYRRARIAHMSNNQVASLEFYQKTIRVGASSKEYFACNAALQMAIIYEHQGALEKAKASYEKCLSLRPKNYRNSLHLKAKAGLKKLND